jgi:hypothetical protein
MEVAHRVLKGMLDPGYQRRDVRTLLKEVCTSVATKVEKGDYKDLQSTLPEPWNDLLQSKRAKQVVSGKDDTGQQQKAGLLGNYFLFFFQFRAPIISRNSAGHGFEVLGCMGLTWIGCVSCLFLAQSVQTERFLR